MTISLHGAIPRKSAEEIRELRNRLEGLKNNQYVEILRRIFRLMEESLDRCETVRHLSEPPVAQMVMEAIRQIFLRKNINYIEPNEIPEEVLEDVPTIVMVSCFRKHTA